MTRKQKKTLRRIIVSAVLYVLLLVIGAEHRGWLGLALFLIPYAVIGWDVLWRAVRNISNGQVFDENFLMAVATVGAFGCGEYSEAVAVMLFYQVGELFQSVAVSRSRQSISDLMDIRPDYANVEREGELVQVDPEEVAVGDTIVIKPGERVPLDGTVEEGTSALDTAALTGESLPRQVSPGQEVISGCINQTGVLRVKVSKPMGSPPWPRSWTWWRTPPPKRPRRRTLSPALPGTIPRRWFLPPWPWLSCPPCWALGPSPCGCSGR